MTTCPCCSNGIIDEETRLCDRCGVGVPRQQDTSLRQAFGWRHRGKRRQDQDAVGQMTDYARTKEDKA